MTRPLVQSRFGEIGKVRAEAGDALMVWLADQAAPVWLEHGIDRKGGGYFDQLDPLNARNVCAFKRLRVTCRQIFAFSQLDMLGVGGAAQAMDHGLTFLFDRLRHADGGYVRAVSLDGAVLDDRRDLYDLAFTIFALAAAYDRRPDPSLRDSACEVLRFIRSQLGHSQGGFAEGLPPVLPRRQNPHMHLLEACLAWLPHEGTGVFHDEAQALLDLFVNHFWSEADQCLYEYYGDGWTLVSDRQRQVFEPGHHFEWMWLLDRCRGYGLAVPDVIEALDRTALAYGFCKDTGMPYAEVHADGRVADANCRLWVVTEWLRASAQGVSTSDLAQPLDLFWRFLGARRAGFWAERWNAKAGVFVDEPVFASTFYHVVTGILPLLTA